MDQIFQDPIFHKKDEILGFTDEKALTIATGIGFACFLDSKEPDAAYESIIDDIEFDKDVFDDFMAEYIATESISTQWGKLINFEKEIKMAVNAMSKSAGDEINLLKGTEGYTTSAPRKKDGQYYTRATSVFSDGQAVRILFYDPDKPGDKPKYPTPQISFQVFLNKKDITSHLVAGGGKDYGPRKFGKIIGNLLKKNSAKFQAKNKQIQAQKEEIAVIDKEMAELDKQIVSKSSEATQAKERNVFLKKQHEDLKKKSEAAATKKADTDKKQVAETARQKEIDDSTIETISGKTWIEGKTKEFEGNKYDPDKSTKDIAKDIRTDIKEAQKNDRIIDAGTNTYSVKMSKYSMGSSIDVVLKKIPEGANLFSKEWEEYLKSGSQEIPDARKRYSKPVRDTISTIEKIIDQYQKSSVSTEADDYARYKFSSDVTVDGKLSNEETEKIKSEIDTGGQVEITEPRDEFKKMLGKELEQLKTSGDVPTFEIDLRVGKKKDGSAGKVTLNLISADVSTVEGLNDLEGKIKDIVKAHTDNYSMSSDKAVSALAISMLAVRDEYLGESFKDLKGKSHEGLLEAEQIDALDSIISSHLGAVHSQLISKGFEGEGWPLKRGSESVNIRNIMNKSGSNAVDAMFVVKNGLEETELRINIAKSGEEMANEIINTLASFDIEPPPQEQEEDTTIKQSEIPPEELPPNNRAIGSDFKDQNQVTKPVTHEIEDKTVSAIEQRGYIISAYLRNGKWTNLPTESGSIVSEDKLKTAIDKSEAAYDTAGDILSGKHDSDPDKVDQLLDEIAEVIEDDAKLNQVADYYTNLLAQKFAPPTE